MRTRSAMKNIQLRNEDHEKRRWKTMMAVNKRADCQAWNLYTVECLVSIQLASMLYLYIPVGTNGGSERSTIPT